MIRLFFICLVFFCFSCDPPESELNEYALCCEGGPLDSDVGAGHVYVPNMFTPNNDAENDIFYLQANGGIDLIKSFEIKSPGGTALFSRFDILPNDLTKGWDGKVSATETYRGLFYYKIEVRDTTGYLETVEGWACSYLCDDPDKVGNPGNCFFPNQNNGMGGLDENIPSGDCL
ncbi:MAG: hypothetical protein WA004_12640 [Saprospiraceae bacterium]